MLVDDLKIHEQLLLLALSNEEGTLALKAGKLQRALGGVILAELLIGGSIRLDAESGIVTAEEDALPPEDELLYECFDLIKTSSKPRVASQWISRIAKVPKLRRRVAMGLCRLGVLEHNEETVFLFFNREKFPEVDPEPELMLVQRLREAILGETKDIELRTSALLSLCHDSGLLKSHFDSEDLERRKERIELVASGRLLEQSAETPSDILQAQSLMALAKALGQYDPDEFDPSSDEPLPEFANAS